MNGTLYTNSSLSPPDFSEYKTGIVIVKWVYPSITFLGAMGNGLSFAVMIQRRMRYNAVYFYLAILSIADTCVLFGSAFKTALRVWTNYELLHASPAGCKVLMFIFLQSMHMAAWCVVAVSLDRFVSIWFPFKEIPILQPSRAKFITLALFLTLGLYNSHVFWTISLQTVSTGNDTVTLKCTGGDDVFIQDIFPWLNLASYSIIPFVLISALNVAIAFKVIQTKLSMRKMASRLHNFKPSQYKVTVMLLVISLVYLLCTFPFTLYSFLEMRWSDHIKKDPHFAAQMVLFKICCFALMYSNHGSNFLLYCITGARFRKELSVLLRCSKRRGTHLNGFPMVPQRPCAQSTAETRKTNKTCNRSASIDKPSSSRSSGSHRSVRYEETLIEKREIPLIEVTYPSNGRS